LIETIPEDEVVIPEVEDEPMNIFITLGETDLLLVETMETIDTNALLLNVSHSTGFPTSY
jgi:hypothetical protein